MNIEPAGKEQSLIAVRLEPGIGKGCLPRGKKKRIERGRRSISQGWKRNALAFAALFFVHYAEKMCDRATDYRVSRRLVNHPARSDKSIESDDRAEENGGLGHSHTHTWFPSVASSFRAAEDERTVARDTGRNIYIYIYIYLCFCVYV